MQISDDGRYLVIWLYDGSQSTGIYYRKLGADGAPAGEVVRLLDTFDADYQFVAEIDDVFYVQHDRGRAELEAHRAAAAADPEGPLAHGRAGRPVRAERGEHRRQAHLRAVPAGRVLGRAGAATSTARASTT